MSGKASLPVEVIRRT